jgi:type II secretory pathway predicted ATPase ExeA
MSLYLDHFGLRELPFRITPHTEFFFDGANRGSTLDALIYAIVHDEGIVKVTGEVGSGKTMLCRMLLERLPASVETIYLANPSLNRDELLLALADELKLPSPPLHIHQLLLAIQRHLVDLHHAGKQVVVLIDEAHAMPEESLEEIRLLSNLETQRAKLLQIVLFGQPELNSILGTQQMRQLRERVTHNFYLEPLKQTDIATYLMFRLRAAGYHGPDLFSPAAIKRFAQVSHGLTRRLNILADKSLLAAFAANTHLIDANIAKIAVRDARFDDTGVTGQTTTFPTRPMLAAGVAGLCGLALIGWLAWRDSPPTSVAAAVSARPAPTPATTPSPAPTTAPAPSGMADEKLQGVSDPTPAGAGPDASRPLLEHRRKRFKDWIAHADDRHFTIQLLRIEEAKADQAEEFLRRAAALPEATGLHAYRASADGRNWVGVVYGTFASAEEGERGLAALPASWRANQPFIRPIRQIKH